MSDTKNVIELNDNEWTRRQLANAQREVQDLKFINAALEAQIEGQRRGQNVMWLAIFVVGVCVAVAGLL